MKNLKKNVDKNISEEKLRKELKVSEGSASYHSENDVYDLDVTSLDFNTKYRIQSGNQDGQPTYHKNKMVNLKWKDPETNKIHTIPASDFGLYLDPKGYLTSGVGHLLDSKEDLNRLMKRAITPTNTIAGYINKDGETFVTKPPGKSTPFYGGGGSYIEDLSDVELDVDIKEHEDRVTDAIGKDRAKKLSAQERSALTHMVFQTGNLGTNTTQALKNYIDEDDPTEKASKKTIFADHIYKSDTENWYGDPSSKPQWALDRRKKEADWFREEGESTSLDPKAGAGLTTMMDRFKSNIKKKLEGEAPLTPEQLKAMGEQQVKDKQAATMDLKASQISINYPEESDVDREVAEFQAGQEEVTEETPIRQAMDVIHKDNEELRNIDKLLKQKAEEKESSEDTADVNMEDSLSDNKGSFYDQKVKEAKARNEARNKESLRVQNIRKLSKMGELGIRG